MENLISVEIKLTAEINRENGKFYASIRLPNGHTKESMTGRKHSDDAIGDLKKMVNRYIELEIVAESVGEPD